MTIGRLVAIIFIFIFITLAWMALGTSIIIRTDYGNSTLGPQVADLWGSAHQQNAPTVAWRRSTAVAEPVELDSSKIDVDLKLMHRRKGLLWYSTYDVAFDGQYTFTNTFDEAKPLEVTFRFPASGTIYDDFEFRVWDKSVSPNNQAYDNTITTVVEVPAGKQVDIHIVYKSRGLDSWRYSFSDGITTVKDFSLTVNTDFFEYDFPVATISPSTKTQTAQGWTLTWEFNNLVSDFDIGVQMPTRLNPGPLASRISYFAPVSLLFFFTILIVLGAVNGRNLHPMHYFFLGASFFAFHILFSYLVDHLPIELSFIIAALVSMVLAFGYLVRAASLRYAAWAGIAQFLFLVLFSYAFFFEGYTGLVITIGAIITLAVMMQMTAKVDWVEVFRKKEKV